MNNQDRKPKEIILELLLDGFSGENLKKLGFTNEPMLFLCGTKDSPLSISPLIKYEGQFSSLFFHISLSGPMIPSNKYKKEEYRPTNIEVYLKKSKTAPRGFIRTYKYSKNRVYNGPCCDKNLKELYKSLRDSDL